ncbi:ABC transporter permease [Paenibacillus sp. HW567]|uniref:ABC transporter permease n=1 Tax=Paenibacillus sp. HW567 TaxID=1034769 RepID=UPI000369146F|nr:ABC transporter permease [Paenibacillus sp. HW567]
MNDILTIIRFTLFKRLFSKPFWIMTFIFVLLITLIVNLPNIYSSLYSNPTVKVGIYQSTIAQQLQKQINSSMIDLKIYPALDSANQKYIQEKVNRKEIDGFLVEKKDQFFSSFQYRFQSPPSSATLSEIQSALQTIKQNQLITNSGLSKEQLSELVAPVQVDMNPINQKINSAESQNSIYYLAYGLFFIMFFMNSMYGNMLASEVTIEKSNRVMEIIVCSVDPFKQMCGKILGLFVACILQLSILTGSALINLTLPQNRSFFNIDLHKIPGNLFIFFISYFILCYFLYAAIYLSAGSMVSKTEELGQATMPISFLLLAGFYLGIYGFQAGPNSIIHVVSFVPFFSPFVMFMRIAVYGAPTWVIVLSISELVASIFVLAFLSLRIYSSGVLIYGNKLSWRRAFSMIRIKRSGT